MREHTGAAIGVAAALTFFATILAWLLVVLVWTALTIYAVVKWVGSAPEGASATTVLLVIVGLVSALTLLMTLPVALVGRSLTPRKRARGEGPPEAIVPADRSEADSGPPDPATP